MAPTSCPSRLYESSRMISLAFFLNMTCILVIGGGVSGLPMRTTGHGFSVFVGSTLPSAMPVVLLLLGCSSTPCVPLLSIPSVRCTGLSFFLWGRLVLQNCRWTDFQRGRNGRALKEPSTVHTLASSLGLWIIVVPKTSNFCLIVLRSRRFCWHGLSASSQVCRRPHVACFVRSQFQRRYWHDKYAKNEITVCCIGWLRPCQKGWCAPLLVSSSNGRCSPF